MKKIFTLVMFMAAALSVSAADFQLYHGTEVLANDAAYTVGYEKVEVIPNLIYRYVWDADLNLQANPADEMVVEVLSSKPDVQFCGFDNQCVTTKAGEAVVKVGKTSSSAAESLRIDYVNANQLQETDNVVTVTVYAKAAPADKKVVTITMVPKDAAEVGGVGSVQTDDNEPAVIYDLLGRRIEPQHVTKGIYLVVKGGKTRKVVVK